MCEKDDDKKTKYGEEIPSMFSWITIDKQRKRAEELSNMTKNKDQES